MLWGSRPPIRGASQSHANGHDAPTTRRVQPRADHEHPAGPVNEILTIRCSDPSARWTGVERASDMPEEWFTYLALGERLGISAEAARQKAIRYRWPRRTTNGGKTQVRLDLEDVRATLTPRKSKTPADTRPTPEQPPVELPADARILAAVEEHVVTLKFMVTKAEELAAHERERAEAERERADGERARADAERVRADALTQNVADLARQLAQAVEAASGRERDLTERLVQARADLAARQARPWWRRLAG